MLAPHIIAAQAAREKAAFDSASVSMSQIEVNMLARFLEDALARCGRAEPAHASRLMD